MSARPVLRSLAKRWPAWLGAALMLACSDRLASSEIGNPPKRGVVVGVLYGEDGRPAAGARVALLPTAYDPVRDTGLALRYDTTDARGAFAIDSVDSGSYNVQAVDPASRARALVQGIEVRSDTAVAGGRNVLKPTGAVSVLLPDSVPVKTAYVYLPGTEVFATSASLKGESRLMLLDSVPAGQSPAIVYRSAADTGSHPITIRISEGVEVVPGDTVPASAFQEWAHSARIFLNTTPTGADMVTGPVLGFPMLVRLGPGAAVFAGAKADGSDLRFAKADGRPLPFEIEHWDKTGSDAAIWVRMDTVYANDSSRYIRMYWGNPEATPAIQARPVFDTAGGYEGIWHMDGLQAGSPPQLRDGSNASNPLLAGGGFTARDLVPSPLGLGIRLDGSPRTLSTGKSFDGPNPFSISLWFKTVSDSGGKLIGFGALPDTSDTARDRQLWLDTLGKVHFGVFPKAGQKLAQDVLSSAVPLNDGQWHMVAGVLWPGGQVLYVDGRKAGEDPSVTTAQSIPKGYWKVGFDFPFYDWPFPPKATYFHGDIDEVRAAKKSYSREWMLLSYENQRPDSRFLRFDKP
jgi:hypothetical protein